MAGVGNAGGGLPGEREGEEEDVEATVREDCQGQYPEGCLDGERELAKYTWERTHTAKGLQGTHEWPGDRLLD